LSLRNFNFYCVAMIVGNVFSRFLTVFHNICNICNIHNKNKWWRKLFFFGKNEDSPNTPI
jgi:hypothetical protein